MEEENEFQNNTNDESVDNSKNMALQSDFKVGDFFKSSDPYKMNPGSRERNTPGTFRQETTDIYQAAFDFGRDLRMKKEVKSFKEREAVKTRAAMINNKPAPSFGNINKGKQVTGLQTNPYIFGSFSPQSITVPSKNKKTGK